jgi:hypothetical protein
MGVERRAVKPISPPEVTPTHLTVSPVAGGGGVRATQKENAMLRFCSLTFAGLMAVSLMAMLVASTALDTSDFALGMSVYGRLIVPPAAFILLMLLVGIKALRSPDA